MTRSYKYTSKNIRYKIIMERETKPDLVFNIEDKEYK